ncbi:hypothetical protein Cob_v010967 [Colletotrichum orbiculare MAFF 240422]|uniref:Uncharacterized protein n=1 Tax=Colletotrichum orbiculare (strain 104-T / ATCC 96160 / CBS 514.97 / LARS 414 / MAFF 240422) TaxID=1213857 RepID=A0A484FEY9_COLOR|nr:hypothetical protein Cob_v010967 [Colletotrichum orbiculare MAFF 240422]
MEVGKVELGRCCQESSLFKRPSSPKQTFLERGAKSDSRHIEKRWQSLQSKTRLRISTPRHEPNSQTPPLALPPSFPTLH